MPESDANWREDASEIYRSLAAIAVPDRAGQMAALLTLAPFAMQENFRVVELGCGEGLLAHAFLAAFPRVEVLALDGSASMRTAAGKRLAPFGGRAQVQAFDLFSEDWLPRAQSADLLVSSLCLHHLKAEGKQQLFHRLADLLSPRGALLIADLIEPSAAAGRRLFADTWDRSAFTQAQGLEHGRVLFDKFIDTKWNYFRFPDEIDHPSGLFEQLQWLKDSGFSVVDCFWMQAGHGIYGGYRESALQQVEGISFAAALSAAETALAAAGNLKKL